jgi:hypothetical protein
MSNRATRWIFLELMRPVIILGKLAGKVYTVLFGRWELRSSIEAEAQLAREIRRDVPFLFHEYAGRIIPDPTVKHPQPFDFASVVVATDELLFRFFQGRGELGIWVTAPRAPTDWNNIFQVFAALDEDFAGPKWILFWSDVTRLLRPRMEKLKEAFAEENYAALEQRLSKLRAHEKAVIRECEIELNRRLYPDK